MCIRDSYYVSEDVRSAFTDLKARREEAFNAWNATYEQWRREMCIRDSISRVCPTAAQACFRDNSCG